MVGHFGDDTVTNLMMPTNSVKALKNGS